MTYTCVFCVLLFVGISTAANSDVNCMTGSDCQPNECCRSNIQPRGRRADFNIHGGVCREMGAQGSKCIVHELETGRDGLFYDCPCQSGYVCKSTGEIVFNKGIAGECALSNITSTLGQPCRVLSDCSLAECCIRDPHTIGKRQFFDDADSHCGQCLN